MRRHFWLKALGIPAFMVVFFAAYFHVLHNPAGPVFEMPLTALDRAIPFQPSWLAAYVSLWLYVGLPPGFFVRPRTLAVYGLCIGTMCLSGLAIFLVWPTAVPLPAHDLDLARHPGFAILQGVDATGNACPSLHVATAVFSAIWLHTALTRLGARAPVVAASWLWCVLILYSTVAIRQHVVLDVAGGAALGIAFAWPALRWARVDDDVR
jgi:membrane-associated phospholipid phosphatase